jgi:hypothetical protein
MHPVNLRSYKGIKYTFSDDLHFSCYNGSYNGGQQDGLWYCGTFSVSYKKYTQALDS